MDEKIKGIEIIDDNNNSDISACILFGRVYIGIGYDFHGRLTPTYDQGYEEYLEVELEKYQAIKLRDWLSEAIEVM